jgi:signal transduction histidine kinase
MLAHDFRGPMTVIRGYAETLLEPGLSSAEVRERAGLIVQSVDRLERMTTETLDFVRGGGTLARRSVDLAGFLRDLAEGLAQELPGLAVVADFDLPADTRAAIDGDKLRRALGNMAANARDAMRGQGRFHVSARLEPALEAGQPPWLGLVVADEGPGVAAEIRDRVFQPFATLGKKRGTGLGLAVARRFVEDHGGTIELLPDAPGHGARFRIRIPLAPTAGGASRTV